jgi:uncharacterized protein (UPF0332 family)
VSEPSLPSAWKRAQDSLRAAEVLHGQALYADAVSRSYYAVMHAARAALLANGVVAESHNAVRRLLGQHLVKPGLIEPEWARILGVEQDRRISADYDTETVWDEEGSNRLLIDARRFLERIHAYLVSAGHDPES